MYIEYFNNNDNDPGNPGVRGWYGKSISGK